MKKSLNEAKLYTFSGADGIKVKHKNMCHQVARKIYFQLKEKGKNVKYMEGEVYAPMEYGKYKWIEHAWNLIDNMLFDFAYGQNDYEYKGYIVKDEYMEMLPDWMQSWVDPEDVCDINIRVGEEYGNEAYED